MSKPLHRTLLYRLIAAGYLAHAAVLAPVRERGLAPGDDALLLTIGPDGCGETELADALGLSSAQLRERLGPLQARGLVDVQPALLRLTDRGCRIAEALTGHWRRTEAQVLADLDPAARKALKRALRQIGRTLKP
jgi:DNA-binding MarR family transcriptional regulator